MHVREQQMKHLTFETTQQLKQSVKNILKIEIL